MLKKFIMSVIVAVSLLVPSIASAASVQANQYVNVRTGGSLSSKVIGHLNTGDQAEIYEIGEKWTKINYKGQVAYVSANPNYTHVEFTKAEQLIQFGERFMGAPYGFGQRVIVDDKFVKGDCSAFTQFVYGHFGVKLPWGSKLQAKVGQPIAKNELQPGDLIFTDTNRDGVVNHVSIYMGNDQVLHTYKVGVGVTITKFSGSVYDRTFVNARRVL